MTISHETEYMKIGDGYSMFQMHGTRAADALHFHEDGEVLMHATDAATPEVDIADTMRDMFTNWTSDDRPNADTFGGTKTEGTRLALTRDIYENEISQEVAAIEKLIIGEAAEITLGLKELPLHRLAIFTGNLPSDVSNTEPTNWAGEGDVVSLRELLVGGLSTLPFFSWCLRIQNSRKSVSGNTLYDWYYAPRCQADPNMEIAFVKNDIVNIEGKIHVLPSKQLHELTAGEYTFTDPSDTKVYYTMRSREGKGGLIRIFYETDEAA